MHRWRDIEETLDGFYEQAEKQPRKPKLAKTSLQDVIDTIRVKQAIKDAKKEEGTNNEVYGYWCNRTLVNTLLSN